MDYQRAQRLLIRDEIHGDITFDPLLERAIDHASVQRLRSIKQLGLAEYVFPCATHTRFQHSLGSAYLGGRYFKNFTEQWMSSAPHVKDTSEGTSFFTAETYRCIRSVVESSSSRKFWYQVVSLGGLLHDVGHGPWSHTFESLPFRQNFTDAVPNLPAPIRAYFDDLAKQKKRLMHEDISVLYIFEILRDLEKDKMLPDADLYALPVVLLVHRKLARGKFKAELESALAALLKKHDVEGGVEFHRLLTPIISGPFDVDRMDYIQRDGRNCGVSIGAIEWRRIVNKLIPCLAEHAGDNEPNEVVLLSSIKNQHVLDDFVFSLFQMYTQVYLHPTIVGLEEIIKSLLVKKQKQLEGFEVTLDVHKTLSDEKLKELFTEKFGINEIEDLLLRRRNILFDVVNYPEDARMVPDLKANGFKLINSMDRAMMKESLGVFLFSKFQPQDPEKVPTIYLNAWNKVSPIARHFYNVNYSPSFWIRQRS